MICDAICIEKLHLVPARLPPFCYCVDTLAPFSIVSKMVPWNRRGVRWAVAAALSCSHVWRLQDVPFEVLVARDQPATAPPASSQQFPRLAQPFLLRIGDSLAHVYADVYVYVFVCAYVYAYVY